MTPEKLSELEALAALAESEKWRERWEALDAIAFQKVTDRLKKERDEARAGLDYLARVAGAAMGLRVIDFAGGEEVSPTPEHEHALFGAFRKTIRERDEARAALKPSGHNAESCCCPDCCTLREARAELKAEAEALTYTANTAAKERDEALAALRMLWEQFDFVCGAADIRHLQLDESAIATVQAALGNTDPNKTRED